ncbi:Cytochrome b6 [bacterium HR39]|nr:Cytochrome b6 [bacterium HR39]
MKQLLRRAFAAAEDLLGRAFPPAWNPLLNLGALGFFFLWIVVVSGVYVYIFFDTGILQAYASVEYMTNDQWYAAGVMRSLHRYTSDGLVVVMLLHMAREFALERYRGARWFSWVTGVPVMVLMYVAGITGYWLVWDELAFYVALVTTKWFDAAGIFGEPIARNFLSVEHLNDRFFTLMVFLHIAVPLIALILLWVHLQRITRPRINPPRGLAAGVLASLLVLSLVHPATSQGPADLTRVPAEVGLDWFYLPLYPFFDRLPGPLTWTASFVLLFLFLSIPWLPPMRRRRPARVDPANCNGCARCFADCPYNAITMVPRTDGRPFEREPLVDPSLCVSCGICAGACPTSMPFRRRAELSPGIDLPDLPIALVRERVHEAAARLSGRPRVLVFGCEPGVPLDRLDGPAVGTVSLTCAGQLPPAFVDYVLARGLAEGVLITGCAENGCLHRFGIDWTKARLARERDPRLRARVPDERVRTAFVGVLGRARLERELAAFREELARLEARESVRAPAARVEVAHE